jgi:K+-transporting ATPase KdpF subunit
MKHSNSFPFRITPPQLEAVQAIWRQLMQGKLSRSILLAFGVNLIIAPAVLAATGGELSHTQAYALGFLGLVTVAYSVYLLVVMFQPERF